MEATWKSSQSGFSETDLGLDGLEDADWLGLERMDPGDKGGGINCTGEETTDILAIRGTFFFGTLTNSSRALTSDLLSYK